MVMHIAFAGGYWYIKLFLINMYLNCYCHSSLNNIPFNERLTMSKSSSVGATAQAVTWSWSKSKELREADVDITKPIKITLHLSCDLY